MKKDIKHTITLTEAEGAVQRCEAMAAKLEADPTLVNNAQLRKGDLKIEKWWRMISGIMVIVACVLYTFYLTIPAVIVALLLVGFMVYVFIKLYNQRKAMDTVDPEISPNRCIETLIRRALGMEITGRDISHYMNAADVAALGASLKTALADAGISGNIVIMRTDVRVTETTQLTEKCGRIPVTVLLASGPNQAAVKWDAAFALSATGDCMVDTKLNI